MNDELKYMRPKEYNMFLLNDDEFHETVTLE
jgi:hypothetical protein